MIKQSEREAEKQKFSPLNLRKNVSFYVSIKYDIQYLQMQNETQLKPIEYKEKPDQDRALYISKTFRKMISPVSCNNSQEGDKEAIEQNYFVSKIFISNILFRIILILKLMISLCTVIS